VVVTPHEEKTTNGSAEQIGYSVRLNTPKSCHFVGSVLPQAGLRTNYAKIAQCASILTDETS